MDLGTGSQELPLVIPHVLRIALPARSADSVWQSPQTQPAAQGLASGDGLRTTASRAGQLASSEQGIFVGFRQAREDWAGLAQRHARDPAVQRWVRSEMARVDAWISRRFERADFVGGWMHDLVDPDSGVPATWKADAAVPAAGNSDKERKFKAAWVSRGRSHNIAQVQAAARLYKLTGETKYAQWAAEQLDFYAENYAKWPLQTLNGRARMFAQGLDEATHAFPLLDAVRLLEGHASRDRQTQWREKLFQPMAENLRHPETQLNNLSLWRKSAIGAIAMRYGDNALLKEALDGNTGVRAILARCVTADNLWIEGSFLYNNYVVNALSQLLVRASLEGHDAEVNDLKTAALKLLLSPIDYAFDDGKLPNPSDSTGVQNAISVNAHWQLARVVQTWWGVTKAASVRNWDSLLDPPPAVNDKTAPSLPRASTRNFPAVRHAVLRAGDWQAYVHYGQLDSNHYQQEMLNFELYDGKTPISTDAGTVSYGSRFSKDYFRKGAANNVPLVDGEGQPKPAPGDIVSFSAPESRLVVEQPAYQPGVSVRRGYRVTTTGFAEQTRFIVANGTPRRLGIAFNTGCTLAPSAGLTASASTALPDASAFSFWKNVRSFTADSQWQLDLRCDGKRYRMLVRGPAGQTVYLGQVPDTPLPAERQGVYYDVKGREASFETEIRAAD